MMGKSGWWIVNYGLWIMDNGWWMGNGKME
jgi:hypothetical protein